MEDMTTGMLISLLAIVAVSVVVYRVFAFLRADVGTCAPAQQTAADTATGALPALNTSY